MLMLSVVAAIDWNWNVSRPGKLSKAGKQLYKCKVTTIFQLANKQTKLPIGQQDRQQNNSRACQSCKGLQLSVDNLQ